jgi:heme A synthase
MSRLARFSWAVLAYNVAVILWGAYVRATGSGAGCGAHWPLCNGEVVPRAPDTAMLIEFSHRLTSGLALVSVVILLGWVWRACAPGHPARRAAALSVFFMLTEAAVGAGLVLFQLVADNASAARAMFMAVHLVNTFTLLACITLTAWWVSGGQPVALSGRMPALAGITALCLAVLITGTSGAIAALGDTLFPSTSLGDALWSDLSMTSHLLIRLRLLHPVIAVATALALIAGVPRLSRLGPPPANQLGRAVFVRVLLQVALGVTNVILLAPVWIQLVHLLMADALWITLILLGATVLAAREEVAAAPAAESIYPERRGLEGVR